MPNQLVVEEIDEHEAYFQIIGAKDVWGAVGRRGTHG